MDAITPLELALPRNSTASEEYLYSKEFTKLMLQRLPKQVSNLRLVLRSANGGECRVFNVSNTNRIFIIVDHNFFWFEYDLMSRKSKIHCVLI